jgi:hypothetical protein
MSYDSRAMELLFRYYNGEMANLSRLAENCGRVQCHVNIGSDAIQNSEALTCIQSFSGQSEVIPLSVLIIVE